MDQEKSTVDGEVQNSKDSVGGPRKSIDTPVKSIDKAAEEVFKEKIPFVFSNSCHGRRGMRRAFSSGLCMYQLSQYVSDLLQKRSHKRGASHSPVEATQWRVRARLSSLHPVVGPFIREKPREELSYEKHNVEELIQKHVQEEPIEEDEPLGEEEPLEVEQEEPQEDEPLEEDEEPIEEEPLEEDEEPIEEEPLEEEEETFEEEPLEEWTKQDLPEEPLEEKFVEEVLSSSIGSCGWLVDDEINEEESVNQVLSEEELVEYEPTEEDLPEDRSAASSNSRS